MNIFSSDQMKILMAARSVSLNINFPLSRCFCFVSSKIKCLDCFIYGANCRSLKTTVRIEYLRFNYLMHFFDASVPISLRLLIRFRNYGLGAVCAHSARNFFTRGCTWLLKLIPSILNRFSTHVEPFHNLLIGHGSSLEGDNLAPLRLVCHNLPITWKNWMKI